MGGIWLAPVALGFVLIGIGLMLFVWPELLAFVVAAVFVTGGLSLLGTGWRMRQRVTYQRLDPTWQVKDEG